ncbi:hypothetical protein ACIPVB_02505 [Microbacterium sp. NPDC090007]|uniref:hypothetical protein n=1 Tax=Microbacterium sp. NPDC090007 TaxID=3364204 RepID=UPI0037F5788A
MERDEFGSPFSIEDGILVRRAPQDAVPYAIFEGIAPTFDEITAVRDRGYGVHLILSNSNLEFLQHLGGLTHLAIYGHNVDTRIIAQMRGLASLELMVSDSPETDLSGLANLTWYFGTLKAFESVLRAPNLQSAEFHDVYEGSFSFIPYRLRELTLQGARQIRSVSVGRGPDESRLRSLYLHGARRFDVRSLAEFRHLETLVLESVVNVDGVSTLRDLSTLKRLSVIRCRTADGLASLAEVRGLEVTVVGNLATSVRELVEKSDPPWTLLSSV